MNLTFFQLKDKHGEDVLVNPQHIIRAVPHKETYTRISLTPDYDSLTNHIIADIKFKDFIKLIQTGEAK